MGRVRATILGSENKPDLVGAVFNAIRNRYTTYVFTQRSVAAMPAAAVGELSAPGWWT
jgi:hypothetical protein